jgi:hypothetical protein
MDTEANQAAEDAKPKRRTKRPRKAKGSDSTECNTEPNSTPLLDSTPSPPVDMDLESNPPPTNDLSSLKPSTTSPDLLNPPTRATNQRERSSSMTSGASGVTLVDSEGVGTEESRENSPADTAVDSEDVPDTKTSGKVRSKAKGSTPPPHPRRSARAAKKITTQTVKRPSAPARSRSKRVSA